MGNWLTYSLLFDKKGVEIREALPPKLQKLLLSLGPAIWLEIDLNFWVLLNKDVLLELIV